MVFKTHYNTGPSQGEVNTKPSQTIPQQSYTVKEIMTRYSQGLGWTGPKIPVYDNGEDPLDGIDLERLDLSERAQILSQVTDRVNVLRHEMAEKLKPKKLQQHIPPTPDNTLRGSLPPSEDNNLNATAF